MNTIRALIVDDEPSARLGLRRELERDQEIEIVGECGNGRDALTAIQDARPDLVLLDLVMPDLDGLGVVQAVGIDALPALVFVTAHDQFAVKAFEVHALDYVLKPVDGLRFQQVLHRAKRHIRRDGPADLGSRLLALLQDLRHEPVHASSPLAPQRVVIKSAGTISFLDVDDIDWIQAADNYVLLHVGTTAHLLHTTMSRIEEKLAPARFLRVHRSVVINVARIHSLHPLFHGEYVIVLKNGTRLTSSRAYHARLQTLLDSYLR